MPDLTPHPAKFSAEILEVLEEIVDKEAASLGREPSILDPFAGTGRVHELGSKTLGIEIEPEWADYHQRTLCADFFEWSKLIWHYIGAGLRPPVDMAITSPCYGNRMADHHEAKERCRACAGTGMGPRTTVEAVEFCPKCNGKGYRDHTRLTYRHKLGRPPSPNSSATLHWGDAYRDFHLCAWTLLDQLIGGVMVLNVKNFIEDGTEVDIAAWHAGVWGGLGYTIEAHYYVKTKGMLYGANREKRVDNEVVLVMRKPG